MKRKRIEAVFRRVPCQKSDVPDPDAVRMFTSKDVNFRDIERAEAGGLAYSYTPYVSPELQGRCYMFSSI